MPKWEALLAGSRAVAAGYRTREMLAEVDRMLWFAATKSRTASSYRTVRQWVRGSWLYDWLTAQPNSREIVIDLRGSFTVGWLVELGEDAAGPLDRAASSTTSNRFLEHASAHPVRLAGAVLFGAVLASLVRAWPLTDPVLLAVYAFGFCTSVVGLAVTDWAATLANSRTVSLLVAAMDPPERPP